MHRTTTVTALLLISLMGGQAHAGGGCLDPSFGGAGKVTTNFTSQGDGISAIALQADGKIVAAGTAGAGPALTDNIALARYNPDGTLDSGFGIGGKVQTQLSSQGDWASSLALQPDGKIVVAGSVHFTAFQDAAVVRYLPNGSLDTSFGTGGFVTMDFHGHHDVVAAMALQPDGKIVTLDWVDALDLDSSWALVRYDPNGTLDASFGSGGRVITNIGPEDDRAETLALQPDGKILAGGLTLTGFHNSLALARYDSDGTLDSTFGTAGIAKLSFPDEDAGAFALAVLPGGEILVGGSGPGAGAPDYGDLLLARYASDGTLDTSFGTGGYVLTDVNGMSDGAAAVAQAPDGKILLAGYSWHPSQSGNFTLVRYLADGGLDSSFGVDGKVGTDFFGGNDGAAGLLLLSDGRIVLGGAATNPPDDLFGREFALARYLPISCPDVGVTLSDSPDPAAVGQDVTYTATVTNNGPGEATSVVLNETLSGSLTLGPATPSQGSCAPAGLTVLCSLGTLPSGAVATVTVVATPSAVGVIGASATVDADGTDPNPANDSASETTSVTNRPPRCDLARALPRLLWPANHRLHKLRIRGVVDPDGGPVALTITGLTQDEPTRTWHGDPSPDGFGVGGPHAWLRAERDNRGNGRVYVVSFSAQDDHGGTCSGSVAVGVPRRRHHPPVDDGQIYDSTLP